MWPLLVVWNNKSNKNKSSLQVQGIVLLILMSDPCKRFKFCNEPSLSKDQSHDPDISHPEDGIGHSNCTITSSQSLLY